MTVVLVECCSNKYNVGVLSSVLIFVDRMIRGYWNMKKS